MDWQGYAFRVEVFNSHRGEPQLLCRNGEGDAALTAFPRNEGASATSCKGWCGKGGSG